MHLRCLECTYVLLAMQIQRYLNQQFFCVVTRINYNFLQNLKSSSLSKSAILSPRSFVFFNTSFRVELFLGAVVKTQDLGLRPKASLPKKSKREGITLYILH
jgi:hypothetical protein